MAKIDTVEIYVDGKPYEYLIMDKETAQNLVNAVLDVTALKNTSEEHSESIESLVSAVNGINEKNKKTDETLSSHTENLDQLTAAVDSNKKKYAALDETVNSEQKKLSDEIDRAKDVEGPLDRLETPEKDSLVVATNYVLSRVKKGDENTGQIKDLKTSEKDSVVGAVNEVYGYFGGIRLSKTAEGYLHIEDASE